MVFHIAVCAPEQGVRVRLRQLCADYFARRAGSCEVELFESPDALLARDAAGARYELWLICLRGQPGPELPAGYQAAAELRRRGRHSQLAFFAQTAAWAYYAYRVDAIQYILWPPRPEAVWALLDRTVEPAYGPAMPLPTAAGVRVLPFHQIEYVECTQHIVNFHLTSGEAVASLSQRVPFLTLAAPLLSDGRFVQPHRSYLVNLAEVTRLTAGELYLHSGARVPLTPSRAPQVRRALHGWLARARGRG